MKTNTVNPSTLSATNANTKEENNMKTIFDAIGEVKSEEFRKNMIRTSWESRDIYLDYYQLFWNQDNIAVIRLFKQPCLSNRKFHKIMHNFCEMNDSKKRCSELAAAFDRGDFIIKKGHIDGRLVIICQILVD